MDGCMRLVLSVQSVATGEEVCHQISFQHGRVSQYANAWKTSHILICASNID